jgi:hypothetical protein
MSKDPSSLASEVAQVTAGFINLAGFLASPRIIVGAPELPSREHVLKHIDGFLGILAHVQSTYASSGRGWRDAEPHVKALRDRFSEQMPEHGISREITESARACLLHLGIPEPLGGWDAFQGVSDPPIAHLRAAESPLVREAKAAAWRFINWASVFVIPAFFAAHDPEELRAEALERIDRYLETVSLMREDPQERSYEVERGLFGLGPYALRLRELLREWGPGRPPSPELIRTVEACLDAIGIPLPTGDEP